VATVVGIMDRAGWDARTDNIVVVDPRRSRLVWIPRDLWCESIHDRINLAFKIGGHPALKKALREHHVRVKHSLCVARPAVERALEGAIVRVPVTEPREYWYPTEPSRPIEEGRKLVRFSPPAEELQGERLHQWIGARYSPTGDSSDFDRIRRQQAFLRALLEQGFAFDAVVADPDGFSASDPRAFDDLTRVRSTWRFDMYDDVLDRTIDGQRVLVDRPRRFRWRSRRR
jgi:hypothetical protein